jgi:hypothetical protein
VERFNLKHILVLLLLFDSFSFFSYSVLWYSVIIFIINFLYINKYGYVYVLPLICINVIGIIGNKELDADFFKDLWYYFKPIIIFLAGVSILKMFSSIEKFNNFIVIAGAFQSIFNLFSFFFIKTNSPGLLETSVSVSSFVTVYGVVILLYNKFDSAFIKKVKWFLLIISLTTILVSFSRSIILALIICIVIIRGNIKRKNILLITFSISAALLFLYFIPQLPIFVSLYNKIKFSSQELELSSSFYNFDEFVSNWRGYESNLALLAFSKNLNIISLFFGNGFGFLVDLQTYISLKDVFYKYIPKLHNGYLEVLCKTGVVGVSLLILFYLRLILYFKRKKRNSIYPKFYIRFPISLIIIQIVTTYTITGIYNKQALDTTLFILGFYFSFFSANYLNKPLSGSSQHKLYH